MNDVYYVYQHIHPVTNECVYVGKGSYGRAWDVTRSRNENHLHQKWMKEISDLGYIPIDWVVILARNLSEQEAFNMELEYFHTKGEPIFNRRSGEYNHRSKLNDSQALEIYDLCKLKTKTHNELATQYGVSRAAISMIASRKQWKATTACRV